MKVLGGILMAVGILIAGLSGLCSLILLVQDMGDPQSFFDESLIIVGIVGGIPFLIGLGMMFGGWKLLGEKPRV